LILAITRLPQRSRSSTAGHPATPSIIAVFSHVLTRFLWSLSFFLYIYYYTKIAILGRENPNFFDFLKIFLNEGKMNAAQSCGVS
jgi:hypothetical protein